MRSRGPWLVCAVASLVAACGGETGTLQVSVTAAPGGDLLERIDRVRVELGDPPTVVEAERDGDGALRLDLEIDAVNGAGTLRIEGFDAAGDVIAIGTSPPLPLSAVNAAVVVYLGPPGSLAAAPVALDPPRSELGAALLPYGAVLAGGRAADGDARAELIIYNVYDHQLQVGLDLPEGRAGPAVMRGLTDLVYVFGGEDDDGDARAEGWAFNTAAAPAGAYSALVTDGDLPRAGATAVAVGNESFVVTGDPAARLDGLTAMVSELDGAPPLADGAAARVGLDDAAHALVVGAGVGASGAVALDGVEPSDLDGPAELARTGHALVTLPDGRGLVVAGAIDGVPVRSAVVYDPSAREFAVRPDLLATARTGAAVAATTDLVMVAGGADGAGAIIGDAELFDAADLTPIAVVPMAVPRRGAVALPLLNGQILIAGGTDADGAPVGLLELLTPPAR